MILYTLCDTIGGILMFLSLSFISLILFIGGSLGGTQGILVVLGVMIFIGAFALGVGSVSYLGECECYILFDKFVYRLVCLNGLYFN